MSESVIDTLNKEINRFAKEYRRNPKKIILPQRVLSLFIKDIKSIEAFSGKCEVPIYPDIIFRGIKLEGDENIKDWIWVWDEEDSEVRLQYAQKALEK